MLTRTDIQENFETLQSEYVPKSHGRLNEVFSSGSTGMPVRVVKSGLAQVFWLAVTARFHLWNGDDMGLKYGAIKTQKNAETAKYPQGLRSREWGAGFPFATGPAVILNLNAKTDEQAEWLSRAKPNYFLSYPSILEALAKHCLHKVIELPSLSRVHSMSEVLRPEVRHVCREAWDIPIYDNYSTEETGYIALQCPQSEKFLVQPEVVHAEYLNDAGNDCSEGEVGNVIVTPMHNFAMPLVRYEVAIMPKWAAKPRAVGNIRLSTGCWGGRAIWCACRTDKPTIRIIKIFSTALIMWCSSRSSAAPRRSSG